MKFTIYGIPIKTLLKGPMGIFLAMAWGLWICMIWVFIYVATKIPYTAENIFAYVLMGYPFVVLATVGLFAYRHPDRIQPDAPKAPEVTNPWDTMLKPIHVNLTIPVAVLVITCFVVWVKVHLDDNRQAAINAKLLSLGACIKIQSDAGLKPDTEACIKKIFPETK